MVIEPYVVIEIFRSFAGAHPYFLLAIGFFFARESLFIPSVYIALSGRLELSIVVVLMIIMNVVSDAVLHAIGRHVPEDRIRTFFGEKVSSGIDAAETLFSAQDIRTIIISRFVYGTRTAVQILSGMAKMSFARYIAANTISIIVFIILLTGIIKSTRVSLAVFADGVTIAKMTFLIVVLIFVSVRVFRSKHARRWFA